MRQLLNLIITGLVLWLGSLIVPDNIKFENVGAIILVTILIYVIETLIILGTFFALAAIGKFSIVVGIIILVLVGMFSGALCLLLIDHLYDGFWLSGFWTAFCLSFCISISTVSVRKN